jgi:hypothetical protein
MADADLTERGTYHDLYVLASQCLCNIAAKFNLDGHETVALFGRWSSTSAPTVPFLRKLGHNQKSDLIGRTAHRFEE